jgi:hypothetical protein
MAAGTTTSTPVATAATAVAGHGLGIITTDWGDGGHQQPDSGRLR